MISSVLKALRNGIAVMRHSSKLVLVAVLVFIFPLLFLWVNQSFFETASNNINTTEKQKISLLHDSLSVILKNHAESEEVLSSLTKTIISENPEISKIRVTTKEAGGFKIIFSNDLNQIGSFEKSDQLYRSLPLSSANESFIYETYLNNERVWQSFRAVNAGDNELYIFSEHSFGLIDSVMSARKQQSYLALTAIFVFIIALAYWINKQTDWNKQFIAKAERLDEQDVLISMIAHEFRSPLTAIKGYASFLEDSKTLTKDEHRFAANINNSAQRLVVIVNDFLEISRLKANKVNIEKNEIDIRSVIEDVTKELISLASEKGLVLKITLPSLPIILNTDSARLTQVLNNIVSNAIKYTDRGEVEIKCQKLSGGVQILVKDTGMGISASDQKKLFAPFMRVGDVDKTSITGTGLGMWITKELVTQLGGSIGVESIKEVGTHVVIEFKS